MFPYSALLNACSQIKFFVIIYICDLQHSLHINGIFYIRALDKHVHTMLTKQQINVSVLYSFEIWSLAALAQWSLAEPMAS